MRKILKFFLLLTFAVPAAAQTTTVTATVVDTTSTIWKNGNWTLNFVPNPSNPNISAYNINGVPLDPNQLNKVGLIDSSGDLSFTAYQTGLVNPSGALWKLQVCPNATSQCGTYLFATGTNTSLDLSGALTSTIPVPSFQAVSGSYGYNDAEALLHLAVGGTYWNVTTNNQRTWSGTAWVNSTGGSACLLTGCEITGSLIIDQNLTVNGNTQLNGLLNGLPMQEYKTTSDNPAILQNWWRYLHATSVYQGTYLSAGMDVIMPNDSLWEGDWINSQAGPLGCGPNTAVPEYSQNRQAEQIRIAWQAQYGYGGTGLQPVINVMGCSLVNPELYTASPTTITVTTEIGPQYLTNGSVIDMSAGQVIHWNGGGLPYTFGRIYCADDSTSNGITVTIDGVSVGTACGTHNGSAIARVFTTTPNQVYTNHDLALTCTSGHCIFYGVEGRPSPGGGNAGVRVHNTSVGSAPSGWFVGHTDFEDLITDGVNTPSTQLVIYAMGTNDAFLSIPVGTYTSNFEAYFAHELGKPGETPIIVIYRPGLDIAPSQSYFEALTTYGYAHNMLVIDQTNRWGTGCTTGCWWLGNDNIHMNDGANLDSSHTMLTGLTDVIHGQPISPLAGDTGLNAGVYRVTSPASSGFIGTPGYTWDGVPGIPSMKGIYGWQTGANANLPGVIGLFDPNYAGLVWMTNVNNDFCIHVPTSGANFTTCNGKHFRIIKSTGEVDTANNVLDDGTGKTLFVTLETISARRGTFTCTAGGTITISNINYAATSDVIITMNTQGGTITTPPAFKTVTPATGFTVLCGVTDTSVYNYNILN